jgi:hypothetical protein
VSWLKQALRFWNKVISRASSDLVHAAMRESVDAVLCGDQAGGGNRKGWAGQLLKVVELLGVRRAGEARNAEGALVGFNVAGVINALQLRLDGLAWADLSEDMLRHSVRGCPTELSKGFKMLTYRKWFEAPGGWVRKHTFGYHLQRAEQIQVVAQFRVGSHKLGIETGRHGAGRCARDERVCPHCSLGRREDEMHLFFECPKYADLRAQYQELFEGNTAVDDAAMCKRMNGTKRRYWRALADFLIQCERLREAGRAVGGGEGGGEHRR